MRQFVLLAHDVPTTPDFSLDDLAGGAGRLDALCRSITASFVLSHGIRESVRVHLVIADELTVVFEGSELRRLNPDERSTAALVRTALAHREEAIGALPAEPSPGVALYRRDLAATLEAVAAEGPVVELHEDGEAIVESGVETLSGAAFVLSDHREVTADERRLLESVVDRRIRVGPRTLHADDAITVVHHYLDTDGYERF